MSIAIGRAFARSTKIHNNPETERYKTAVAPMGSTIGRLK